MSPSTSVTFITATYIFSLESRQHKLRSRCSRFQLRQSNLHPHELRNRLPPAAPPPLWLEPTPRILVFKPITAEPAISQVAQAAPSSLRANPATAGLRTATLTRTCSTGGTASTITNGLKVLTPGKSLAKPMIFTAGDGTAGQICVLSSDGSVKCWGYGANGRLGYDSTTNIGDGSGTLMANLATINLGTNKTAVQIAGGETHTCAILNDGTLKCWGAAPTEPSEKTIPQRLGRSRDHDGKPHHHQLRNRHDGYPSHSGTQLHLCNSE